MKKQTAKLLSLLLSLVMLAALCVPAFAADDDSPLWFIWLDHDWETGERLLYMNPEGFGAGNGLGIPAGGYSQTGLLGYGPGYDEEGHFDLDHFTPVAIQDLKIPAGLKIEPAAAREGEKWGEYYVEITATERDKQGLITYGRHRLQVDTRLPDVGVYTAPEASWDTWAGPGGFAYSPILDNEYYLISTATDATHDRHLEKLAFNSWEENKLVSMSKISDTVYKLELKPEALKHDNFHLEFDITWGNEWGDTWTDNFQYIGDFDARASLAASDTALVDGTQENNQWVIFSKVADKLSNKVTMKAGENKELYIYNLTFSASRGGFGAFHIPDVNVFFPTSTDLTLTADSKDYSKFTLSADKPGTYEIYFGYQRYDTLYHANGKAYTEADYEDYESKILWRISYGQLLVCDDWTFDEQTGYTLNTEYVPFEEMFPGETYTLAEPEAFDANRLTVTVLPNYSDVKDTDWFHDSVMTIAASGLMGGTSAATFSPSANVTRETVPAALYRMAGSPAAKAGSFTDVKAGQWYTDPINWAAETGVVTGVSTTSFGLGSNITREQLAAMLYRFSKNQGMDVSASDDLSSFADAANIHSWAVAEMKWAVGAGIINGKGANLDPQGTATRAELATMLVRLRNALM